METKEAMGEMKRARGSRARRTDREGTEEGEGKNGNQSTEEGSRMEDGEER